MLRIIGIGEKTGNVGEILDQMALFYREEIDQKVGGLMSLIEPILMVFITSIVGDIFDFINILKDDSISCIIFNGFDISIINSYNGFRWLFKHFARILKKGGFIIGNYELLDINKKDIEGFEYKETTFYTNITKKK